MSQLKFSILVACYNQRDFVRAAVESAISQASPSKEIIVIDDCSTDGTAEVLDEFGDSIQLVKFETNQGAIAARNYAANLATGEYLVFLDGDDIFMPWTLEVYERLIQVHNPKIILGRRFYFQGEDPKTEDMKVPDTLDYISYQNWFQKDREVACGASTFVVDHKAYSDASGWSPGIFHLDMHDILLKLGLSGSTIVILSPATACYRKHSANVTLAIAKILECAHLLLKKEKEGEYPGGRENRFARYSLIGGPILSWVLRAVKSRLFVQAVRLVWPAKVLVLVAIIRRLVVLLKGQRPAQSLRIRAD